MGWSRCEGRAGAGLAASRGLVAYLYTGVGNFIGMRWADWTGSQVPADVLEDLLNVLADGLPPVPG